jgi:hypothetical protein
VPRHPKTLSPDQLQHFHDDGYVVLRNAFARQDALAMQDEWWAELSEVHGIERDDRSTWRRVLGDLKRPKRSPSEQRIATAKVRGAIDDLLGEGAWRIPADWGRALVTFPEPGDWDVPAGLWHWDSPVELHEELLNALFVVSFVGEVVPRGGGTLVLSGSHRLLRRHERTLSEAELRADAYTRRELFYRSHPWLAALADLSAHTGGRIEAFMRTDADLEGIASRVVELTGEPGDMVLCHPSIVHCVAPNRGAAPRFMRIKQQLMTERGRARMKMSRSSRKTHRGR